MQLDAEIGALRAALRAAGARIRTGYDRARTIEHKGRIDLVTDTDRAAEAIVLEQLHARFPNDPVVAEEGSPSYRGEVPRRWLVDPLDGTTNFAHGFPWFAVSIALEIDGRVELGGVYEPLRDELFFAHRGQGAFLGERRLQVSAVDGLADALLATGFAYDRQTNPDNNLTEHNELLMRCRGIRRAGSAALDLANVAAGRLDGYWEQGLNPWDMAAGVLLVEEAGGLVRQYDGAPHRLDARSIVACGPGLLGPMVDAVGRSRVPLGRPLPTAELRA